MTVQAGLCPTCSETTLLVLPRGGSKVGDLFYPFRISVTLSGKNSEMFRGFFIQPRTNVDTLSIVGSFSNVVGGTTMQCTDPVAQVSLRLTLI